MKTVTITEKDFQRLLTLAGAAVNDGCGTKSIAEDEAFLERLNETLTNEEK